MHKYFLVLKPQIWKWRVTLLFYHCAVAVPPHCQIRIFRTQQPNLANELSLLSWLNMYYNQLQPTSLQLLTLSALKLVICFNSLPSSIQILKASHAKVKYLLEHRKIFGDKSIFTFFYFCDSMSWSVRVEPVWYNFSSWLQILPLVARFEENI